MSSIIRVPLITQLSLVAVILAGIAVVPFASAEPTPQEIEEEVQSKSFEYAKFVDSAVDALVKGEAARFKEMLSPGTIKREQRGPGAIDVIIEGRFIPFFKNYARMSPNAETIGTRDIDGHRGVAIARSFLSVDGTQHSFVMYVLDESGTLTVGNLLLDATMADLKRGR